MAAPETQFQPAGIQATGYTPVETRLNPPIPLQPARYDLIGQAIQGALAASGLANPMQSPLNPAVRAQMQEEAARYQLGQRELSNMMKNPAEMEKNRPLISFGPNGPTIMPQVSGGPTFYTGQGGNKQPVPPPAPTAAQATADADAKAKAANQGATDPSAPDPNAPSALTPSSGHDVTPTNPATDPFSPSFGYNAASNQTVPSTSPYANPAAPPPPPAPSQQPQTQPNPAGAAPQTQPLTGSGSTAMNQPSIHPVGTAMDALNWGKTFMAGDKAPTGAVYMPYGGSNGQPAYAFTSKNGATQTIPIDQMMRYGFAPHLVSDNLGSALNAIDQREGQPGGIAQTGPVAPPGQPPGAQPQAQPGQIAQTGPVAPGQPQQGPPQQPGQPPPGQPGQLAQAGPPQQPAQQPGQPPAAPGTGYDVNAYRQALAQQPGVLAGTGTQPLSASAQAGPPVNYTPNHNPSNAPSSTSLVHDNPPPMNEETRQPQQEGVPDAGVTNMYQDAVKNGYQNLPRGPGGIYEVGTTGGGIRWYSDPNSNSGMPFLLYGGTPFSQMRMYNDGQWHTVEVPLSNEELTKRILDSGGPDSSAWGGGDAVAKQRAQTNWLRQNYIMHNYGELPPIIQTKLSSFQQQGIWSQRLMDAAKWMQPGDYNFVRQLQNEAAANYHSAEGLPFVDGLWKSFVQKVAGNNPQVNPTLQHFMEAYHNLQATANSTSLDPAENTGLDQIKLDSTLPSMVADYHHDRMVMYQRYLDNAIANNNKVSLESGNVSKSINETERFPDTGSWFSPNTPPPAVSRSPRIIGPGAAPNYGSQANPVQVGPGAQSSPPHKSFYRDAQGVLKWNP